MVRWLCQEDYRHKTLDVVLVLAISHHLCWLYLFRKVGPSLTLIYYVDKKMIVEDEVDVPSQATICIHKTTNS